MAPGQDLVKVWVISPVQLVDRQLPYGWVRPAGAVSSVTVALVRHPGSKQSLTRRLSTSTCSGECRARWALGPEVRRWRSHRGKTGQSSSQTAHCLQPGELSFHSVNILCGLNKPELHLQVGGPHPQHAARRLPGDVGEPLNDQPVARHLRQPVVVRTLGPGVSIFKSLFS